MFVQVKITGNEEALTKVKELFKYLFESKFVPEILPEEDGNTVTYTSRDGYPHDVVLIGEACHYGIKFGVYNEVDSWTWQEEGEDVPSDIMADECFMI